MNAIEHRRTRVPGKIDADVENYLNFPLGDLVVWLAGRFETGFLEGAPVATWTDQSGYGHNATQGTGANQPLFRNNAINSLPALQFDGVNDQLDLGDLSAVVPTTATLFIVATVSTTYNLYTTHSTAAADIWWKYDANGYYGPFRTGRYTSWPTDVPGSGSHLFVVKSTTGVGTYEVIIDNVSKGTQNATHAGGTLHALSYSRKLTGYIAEVLLFNTVLSAGDTDAVEAYLNNLYALY